MPHLLEPMPDVADPLGPPDVLDRVLTAPVDAWTITLLESFDPAGLDEDDRPRYLAAWARVEAHAAARRLAAVALRVPVGSAQAQVHHARRLASHLPGVAAALDRGEISYPHALRALDATRTVDDPAVTRAAEQRVLPRAERLTPGELGAALARVVAAVDPPRVRALSADARFRRLICDPETGHLLDYGQRTYRVPAPLAAFATARHPTGAAPGSSASQRTDNDHVVPWPTGGTDRDNVIPLTRSWHRAKTHAGYQVTVTPDGTVTWTTPLDQTAVVEPFDYRLGP